MSRRQSRRIEVPDGAREGRNMAGDQLRRRQIEERLAGAESTRDLAAAIAEVTAAPGECRIQDGTHDDEYPDVRPVITGAGMAWCCTYGTHCTVVVAPLAARP